MNSHEKIFSRLKNYKYDSRSIIIVIINDERERESEYHKSDERSNGRTDKMKYLLFCVDERAVASARVPYTSN